MSKAIFEKTEKQILANFHSCRFLACTFGVSTALHINFSFWKKKKKPTTKRFADEFQKKTLLSRVKKNSSKTLKYLSEAPVNIYLFNVSNRNTRKG